MNVPLPEPRKEVAPEALKAADAKHLHEPEFLEARNQLVDNVNSWLIQLAARRDAGEELINGTPTSEQPRILSTDLGPSSTNEWTPIGELLAGVYLGGDGVETPLVFQWVQPDPVPGTMHATEVDGADPLHRNIHGNSYDGSRGKLRIINFGTKVVAGGVEVESFRFAIMGDGRIFQRYHKDDYDESGEISSPLYIHIAQLAFGAITSNVE